jgi:hypothetical protein
VDNETVEHTYRKIADGRFVQLTAKGGRNSFVGIVGVDPDTTMCTWWTFGHNRRDSQPSSTTHAKIQMKPFMAWPSTELPLANFRTPDIPPSALGFLGFSSLGVVQQY